MPIAPPWTLAGISEQIAESIHRADEPEALRRIFEFLDDFDASNREARERLIAETPPPTGEVRFDAFLGALGEHLAFHHGLDVPRWVTEAPRFLDRWWFVAPFTSLHATALVESPAAFRRRGIFITENALSRC